MHSNVCSKLSFEYFSTFHTHYKNRIGLGQWIIGYLPLGYLPNYFQGVVRDISRYYPLYIKVLSIMDISIHLPNYFFLSFAQLYQSFAQLFQGFAQLFILNVLPNYIRYLPNYIRDLPYYFFQVFCPIISRTCPIISRICPII